MFGFTKLTSRLPLLAVVLFGILSLQPALAQTQAINGSIRGRVTDAGAASIAQAKVTILNDDTGFTARLTPTRTATTCFRTCRSAVIP